MAILTSSVQTFVDLTDQRKLSTYLTSNLPSIQIKDPNNGALTPNWTSTNLVISPVIYLENESLIPGTTSGLTVTWKRREGANSEASLLSSEVPQTNGTLKINANVLNDTTNTPSGMITYVCKVSYNDPTTLQTVNVQSEMSFSLIKNASNARLVEINGDTVFKYDKNVSLVGATQIELSVSIQGVSITKWQYQGSDGVFVDYPAGTADNSTNTGSTILVKPAHAVFFNNKAVIKVLTNDANVYDTHTIVKLYDGITGDTGQGGLTVTVGNETQQIVTDPAGAIVGEQYINIPFKAFKGIDQIACSVAYSTLPDGIVLVSNTAATTTVEGSLKFKTVNAKLLGSVNSGEITLTFTAASSTFSTKFTWSKSKQGVTGTSSVILTLTTPNGNVIQNGEGSVLIQAYGYDGTTVISSGATYAWRKYVSGAWTTISGQTASSLTVTATDIVNIASFECTMTYGGKTYVSVATVIDKTDPCTSEMIPIGGTTFKNGLGGTAVYVTVRRGGSELDPLKGVISTTAPSSPTTSTYWWKVDESAKTCTLMKYSGTAFAAVTLPADNQTLTYTWYKRNKTGAADGTFGKTGKVIYLSADDVDSIATLQCDVSDSK